jgi:hypothetical protein
MFRDSCIRRSGVLRLLCGTEISGVEVSGVFEVYVVQFFSWGRNVKEVFGS